MPFDYDAHRRSMVERFIWLQQFDPVYARAQLAAYAKDVSCPCSGIVADVQSAWKAKQAADALPKPDK